MVSFLDKIKSSVCAFLFEPQKQDKRYHNIDFIRIVFCFIILLRHSSYLLDFGDKVNKFVAGGGAFCVDAFFILSGFLMYNSIKKGKFTSGKDFVIAKIARLWPVFAFSQLVFILFFALGIINQKFHFHHEFLSLFFIKNIGFNSFVDIFPCSYENGGWHTNTHAWYLGPLFYGMLFYYVILKMLEKKQNAKEITTFSMVFCCLFFCGVFTHIPVVHSLCRGLCFLPLGFLLSIAISEYKDYLQKKCLDSKSNNGNNVYGRKKMQFLLKKIFFSLLELIILWRFQWLMRHNIDGQYKLVYGILFCILLFLFIFDFGYIGKILNRKIFSLVGSWGYSIYIMQWIVQQTLSPFNNNKLYAKCEFYRAFKNEHPIAMFWIYIAICFIVGAFVYYFVEKPCYKKIMNKFGAKKSN